MNELEPYHEEDDRRLMVKCQVETRFKSVVTYKHYDKDVMFIKRVKSVTRFLVLFIYPIGVDSLIENCNKINTPDHVCTQSSKISLWKPSILQTHVLRQLNQHN